MRAEGVCRPVQGAGCRGRGPISTHLVTGRDTLDVSPGVVGRCSAHKEGIMATPRRPPLFTLGWPNWAVIAATVIFLVLVLLLLQ